MPLTHHPLVKEFPNHKDRIHQLKMDDRHFSKLMDNYESLDKEIFRIESGEEAADDTRLESLKYERVNLKDTLFKLLTAD
ncbi:MAG TPA: GTP-binding protein [Gammaproteobacteria bacterium]|jgi:uncharacterized protein YdcH (DUF465 family)|nr:GTP-binding protein [Gammaproteobacteria bacterium]